MTATHTPAGHTATAKARATTRARATAGAHTTARATAAALGAAALLTLAAPTTASAAPTASMSSTTVSPGGRIGLNLQGCGTRTGRVTSTAFGELWLTPGNLESTTLIGTAQAYRDARSGAHSVVFECGGAGGQRVTLTLQVTPGAARGGTGGSIGGISPAEIAIGGSLAAGALGAGVWFLRRRTLTN
ncbi:hypothetical protein [Streptomyces sp. NPDC089799]|uniref:hypothetical protein n=1 Tax=Streptomyces sp. NPDC089799 TaxID=3155066 RepID=UPI00342D9EF6